MALERMNQSCLYHWCSREHEQEDNDNLYLFANQKIINVIDCAVPTKHTEVLKLSEVDSLMSL